MTVNNSTNINNHTQSPLKKVLNSDGQQFHQYQQPHTITSKESLNSDGQQFHQYQQPHTITSKESLNSDGQQLHQYKQPHTITSKESLNSDGLQFHQYQQPANFVDSVGQSINEYKNLHKVHNIVSFLFTGIPLLYLYILIILQCRKPWIS